MLRAWQELSRDGFRASSSWRSPGSSTAQALTIGVRDFGVRSRRYMSLCDFVFARTRRPCGSRCTSEHSQVMHVTCMVVLGSHVVLVRYHNTLAMLIVMGGEEIQRGFKKYSMDRHVRPPHSVR